MELWIRSQDRMKLFRGIDFRGVIEQEGCSIVDNTDDYIIGTYKTKERALEVLDEIQKILKPQEYYIETGRGTFTKTSDISTYIYEMPKE